ncbi:hypothetical protein B0H17DRAFT_1134640 [Mycena rosella]|uniref:DUF6697 domain-containing protein n=1 Tax=Mycena rosella TaxID=1033263 RepID=A0AAD7DEQ1_MYCRO|nr:hypothetical protein B0H17DRAFT_1134640 [Mycena rosella]
MDDKSSVELGKHSEEINRLTHENQRLRAEVERVRWERDEAESRFASSQKKVAELEHQVRTQAWRISDLEAEPPIHGGTNKPPPLDPVVPPKPSTLPEVIEIFDQEEDGLEILHDAKIPKEQSSAESAPDAAAQGTPPCHSEMLPIPQTPKKERQFMDFVSVPLARSPSKPRAAAERPSATPPDAEISSTPGRFKRARSASPSLGRSLSSTLVEDDRSVGDLPEQFGVGVLRSVRSVSPSPIPPAKRRKASKTAKVKTAKKEAFTLPKHVIDTHLGNTPNLAIDPVPLDALYVPRAFLRTEYGGSDQQFLQQFTATDGADTGRALVFPQADLNPFLPQAPGEAGLIFASRREIADGRAWALFCKHPAGTAVWRYMGDYRSEVCPEKPTVEQWRSQTPACKAKWGKLIARSKKWPVYVSMRARIALRKAGRAVSPESEAREATKITGKGKKGTPLGLTPQDVIDAFGRGEEAIDIIKMQCVSYDHAFAADMARRYEVCQTPQAEAQRRRAALEKKGKGHEREEGQGQASAQAGLHAGGRVGFQFRFGVCGGIRGFRVRG